MTCSILAVKIFDRFIDDMSTSHIYIYNVCTCITSLLSAHKAVLLLLDWCTCFNHSEENNKE